MNTPQLLLAGLLLAPPPGPATDLYGDPLPQGAFARLGMARLRHGGHGDSVVFSADGRWIYAAARHEVCVWDATTGKLHATLPGKRFSALGHLTLSPDGKYLAAADGSAVHIWDLASGKPPRLLKGHVGPIAGLAFSPDNRTLVSAAADLKIIDYDAKSGIVSFTMEKDREVRFWEVATGKQLNTLDHRIDELSGVTFLDQSRGRFWKMVQRRLFA
jgi:WD40 repeat protein